MEHPIPAVTPDAIQTPKASPAALYDADVDRILRTMPPLRAGFPAWLDGLSQRDRHLIVSEIFHSEVCNGGFAQWYDNGYHDGLLPTLLLILERMPGEVSEVLRRRVLQLLNRAASLIANDDTLDPSPLPCLSEPAHEALGALDDQYYAFSDVWRGEVAHYFSRWV